MSDPLLYTVNESCQRPVYCLLSVSTFQVFNHSQSVSMNYFILLSAVRDVQVYKSTTVLSLPILCGNPESCVSTPLCLLVSGGVKSLLSCAVHASCVAVSWYKIFSSYMNMCRQFVIFFCHLVLDHPTAL